MSLGNSHCRERPQGSFVDSSEKMLKAAGKKVKQRGLQHGITQNKGDVAKTGHVDETFDMIL